MNCDRCGGDDCKVLDTRSTDYQTRRRRRCSKCGHTFATVEVYATFFDRFDKEHFRKWTRGALERVNLRKRDIDISKALHKGADLLMRMYNLTESGLYYAARRGRGYIKEENEAHSHSRKR